MKLKNLLFSLICMFALLGFSQAQNIRLTFSSQLNCEWHPFDSVAIFNMSRNYYSTTLHYPDTILELSADVGIQDAVSNEKVEILLYPNPFTNTVQMHFPLFQAGNTTLTLYDLLGRKITQHSRYLDAGQHSFDLESCPAGYYLLHINTPQGAASAKLVCHGNTTSSIPTIHYNGIQQHEKNRKLYDPNFPFKLNDLFLIKGYYKGSFEEHYANIVQNLEHEFSFFDSSLLTILPIQNVFSSNRNFYLGVPSESITLVNNQEDYKTLFENKYEQIPDVDFTIHSVIYVKGNSPVNIVCVKKQLGKNSFNQYILNIDISEGFQTVPGAWNISIITEKISEITDICLFIYYHES